MSEPVYVLRALEAHSSHDGLRYLVVKPGEFGACMHRDGRVAAAFSEEANAAEYALRLNVPIRKARKQREAVEEDDRREPLRVGRGAGCNCFDLYSPRSMTCVKCGGGPS